MNSGVTPKTMAIAFVAVLVLYVVGFKGIEYLRHSGGPWQVTFQSSDSGTPSIVINQESLEIENVTLSFPGPVAAQSNVNETISFTRVNLSLPFGERIHEDLIYFPGVQNFRLFGHQVELFKRTLRIDGEEIPWKSNSELKIEPVQ